MHALNQLEFFETIKSNLDFIDLLHQENSLQIFLMNKIDITSENLILNSKYNLWGNPGKNDSLDEMTVILNSKRKINQINTAFIGETTFLQEYYENSEIISWSHFEAHNSKYWKQSAPLLEEDYVEEVLSFFSNLNPCNISYTETKIKEQFITNIRPLFSKMDLFFYFLTKESINNKSFLTKINIEVKFEAFGYNKPREYWQFIVYPDIEDKKILQKYKQIDKSSTINRILFPLTGYTIVDVPEDGNCAFTAVKVAQGDEKFRNITDQNLTNEQLNAIKILREQTAKEMGNVVKDRPEFIQMLCQPGFWNSGIDGAVGIEVLSFVALVIGQPILVVTQEPDGKYRYWSSRTVENPRNGNLTFYDIHERNLEKLLNENPNAIKLFHNGIHFQAIVKNDSLPSEGI